MLYDFMLLIAIWAVTGYVVVAVNGGVVVGALWQSLLFVEAFAYFAWSWCATGQTVGMLAWRLQVVSNEGGRFTIDQATYRAMGALVSFVFLGLGHYWLLLNPQRKTWPDMLSDSQIVQLPKATSN